MKRRGLLQILGLGAATAAANPFVDPSGGKVPVAEKKPVPQTFKMRPYVPSKLTSCSTGVVPGPYDML